MNDLFIGGGVGLYLATLVMSVHYSRQNSQPARQVAELIESLVVNAGWLRLAHDIAAPTAGEVRDVEAR